MRRRTGKSTILALAICAGAVSAHAGSDPALDAAARDRLRPIVPAAIEYYAERSADPLPALNHDQIEDLLAGKVVRMRRRHADDSDDPPERVTGYRLVTRPRSEVWVAALDPAFHSTDMVTERKLEEDGEGGSVWHQYLDLPWPLADRQWVIRARPLPELAAATDDLVWEQKWSLVADGPALARASIASGEMGEWTPETTRDAIYMPANEGSWIVFQLEDEVTLLAYRLVARVGGKVPDAWITGLGMAQLGQLLNGVCAHATGVAAQYDPAVHAIFGGDGQIVPAFSPASPAPR